MRLTPFAALTVLALTTPWAGARAGGEGTPKLALPLACDVGRNCEVQNYVDRDDGPGALDFHCGHRTYDKHDGTDIRVLDMAAQRSGVDVLAAAPGTVVAVRDGVPDISIRAPGAPSVVGHECGNRVGIALGGGWIIDYCHLARGSLAVKVGDTVSVGQRLAQVGLSGQTEFPHLHFSVRHGTAVVDPFAPGPVAPPVCASQAGLWTPVAAQALAYRRGAVLNVGFSAGLASMDAVEEASISPPKTTSSIVAYARLIGLEADDVVEVSVIGPDGKVFVRDVLPALDHDKAQWIVQAGRKAAPAGGWPHGAYSAQVQVRRGGAVALSRQWQMLL
ncbi:peptidoglycan DD-metalloendopeptidase family protein [Phenylobacterium sp.]|uniref:peptidoglycan DD-metalloendopeptidase family protein n=1 Tax=Phenylobacterium sp. TaxID=1871053 RepID=UPI001224FEF0|nr:peptidoglycan DD-metalloendopeptidase family protein [Phenylobacterium sp.]THD67172.1 MAG: M23 family peptidase [Phenylobacterium sp.]